MALWKPNATTVAGSEFIGRRLFERPGLKGAKDQRQPDKSFELYHFENSDREVSVDRLGQTSVDGKVKKNYLYPRGHYAATLMHKREFHGWAVTQAKIIQSPPSSYQISPSPIAQEGEEPLTENNFHAHIEMPDRLSPYEMAVILKHIFEKNYRFEPCIPSGKTEGWLGRARRWLAKKLAEVRVKKTTSSA
jgi:hypothetical protein